MLAQFDSHVSCIWRHIISSLHTFRNAQVHTDSVDLLFRNSSKEEGRIAFLGPGCVCVCVTVHSLPVMIQASIRIAWAFKSFRDGLVCVYMCVYSVEGALCCDVLVSEIVSQRETWPYMVCTSYYVVAVISPSHTGGKMGLFALSSLSFFFFFFFPPPSVTLMHHWWKVSGWKKMFSRGKSC